MEFTYKTIRSKRKTLCIQITPVGEIIVRAPLHTDDKSIDSFVFSHREWIEKKLNEITVKNGVLSSADTAPPLTAHELKSMAVEAKVFFSQKCAFYSSLLNVAYRNITIRKARTIWGSCTSRGNLSFNLLLMLVPEEIADYVVVHELCHRRHMDHSKSFWSLVESVIPDYKIRRKWLKDHGNELFSRLPQPKASEHYYTYILKCSDGSYYIGYTNDLNRRIEAHNNGVGARYTKFRRPVRLEYFETFSTKSEAMSREAILKQLSKREKTKLISSHDKR